MPVTKHKAAAEAVDPQVDAFYPLAGLQKAIRFWWLVALLVIAGGMVGWLAHLSRPPVYEAVGHFTTSLDYVRTGPLTQYEEDSAFEVVGSIISSAEILQQVVDRAAAEGIQTNVVELKKASVLERRVNVWDLRVRSADPRAAERLTNLWVEQGQAALLDSHQHTVQADRLDRYLRSLEACLAKAAASEPAGGQCSSARYAEIQADLQSAGAALYQEQLGSRGLFSGVLIGPAEQAVPPNGPALYNRNQMILAGCLIGFLLGIGLVQWANLERLPAWRFVYRPGRS